MKRISKSGQVLVLSVSELRADAKSLFVNNRPKLEEVVDIFL